MAALGESGEIAAGFATLQREVYACCGNFRVDEMAWRDAATGNAARGDDFGDV